MADGGSLSQGGWGSPLGGEQMAGEFFYCIFQGGINTSVFPEVHSMRKSIVPGGQLPRKRADPAG